MLHKIHAARALRAFWRGAKDAGLVMLAGSMAGVAISIVARVTTETAQRLIS